MPVVQVYLWRGRDKEAKRRIVRGITDVLIKEGVPPEAVTVILNDIEKEDWGTAGRCADEPRS